MKAITGGWRAVWGVLALVLVLMLVLGSAIRAQDPHSSSDRPPGNVNELTLAGIRPGRDRIHSAAARLGPHWFHPSRDEDDVYDWCDARTHLQVELEAPRSGVIHVVTVNRLLQMPPGAPAAGGCRAHLSASLARTGRGIRLGDPARRLEAVYGHPFFDGPASWQGRNVHLIVYNFSWAGARKPQILESSFDARGRLVKMTLSADYY